MQLISHSFNLRWPNTKIKVITAYTAAYHRRAFLLVGSHSTLFFIVFFLLSLPHSVYFFSFSKCVCAATGFDRLTHSPHSPRPHSLVVFFFVMCCCCASLIIIISGLATRVTHLYNRSESLKLLLLADGDIDDGVEKI